MEIYIVTLYLFIYQNKKMKKLAIVFYAGIVLPLLAFTTLLSCKKDKPTTVAFEASYTTTNVLIDPPPMLKQEITGIGKSNALNISKFIAVSTQVITNTPPFKLSGPCTYYADNGDVFYTSFTGTSTPNGDGTLTVSMTHTITGGTGKFEHATGSISGKTIVDPKKSSAVIDCKGTVTY
jgi:hypothetical protein